MADGTDKSVDDGMGRFDGEKLRQHQIQEGALPDEHANSTGRVTSDDKIVGADFSGLDNDPVDTASQSVAQYDRAGSEEEVDETVAGGIQFPEDEQEEPSR